MRVVEKGISVYLSEIRGGYELVQANLDPRWLGPACLWSRLVQVGLTIELDMDRCGLGRFLLCVIFYLLLFSFIVSLCEGNP